MNWQKPGGGLGGLQLKSCKLLQILWLYLEEIFCNDNNNFDLFKRGRRKYWLEFTAQPYRDAQQ